MWGMSVIYSEESKSPSNLKLDSFRVKLVNFSSEKVVLVVCYDRNSSAVIG